MGPSRSCPAGFLLHDCWLSQSLLPQPLNQLLHVDLEQRSRSLREGPRVRTSHSGEDRNSAAAAQIPREIWRKKTRSLRLGHSYQPRGQHLVHETGATGDARTSVYPQLPCPGAAGGTESVATAPWWVPCSSSNHRLQTLPGCKTQKDLCSIPGRLQGRGVLHSQRNQRCRQEVAGAGPGTGKSQGLERGGHAAQNPGLWLYLASCAWWQLLPWLSGGRGPSPGLP